MSYCREVYLEYVFTHPLVVFVMLQTLWNQVCVRISENRRMFVPGGLFCGLREEHVVRELHRLWARRFTIPIDDPICDPR
jgi:hypothetical protein